MASKALSRFPSIGASPKNGYSWEARELQMYMRLQQASFGQLCKYSFAGDPSVHGKGEETMAGLLYSWEIGQAANGLVQVMRPGRRVLPDEFLFEDVTEHFIFEQKVPRLKSLRELQASSSMISQYAGKSLDDFMIPDGCALRPVQADECREVEVGDTHNKVWLKQAGGVKVEELPIEFDPGRWNQLTTVTDSGPTIRAGVNFAIHFMSLFMFSMFDKYHGIICDLKNATSKVCSIYRATLFVGFLWTLNRKPFGSGVWFQVKHDMLGHWIQTTSSDDPLFRYYAPRIAKDLDLPLRCERDYENLWRAIPRRCNTCNNRGDHVKSSRWFALNDSYVSQGHEFWIMKLLLRHWYGLGIPPADEDTDDDPADFLKRNPREELRQLQSNCSGFVLAEKLLTNWLHHNIRIYFWCSKSSWSWYTYHVENVRTPKQAVMFYVEASSGSWIQKELRNLFHNCFYNPCALTDMGLHWSGGIADLPAHKSIASKVDQLTWNIASNRAWSNETWRTPPYTYAALLCPDANNSHRNCMDQAKFDSDTLYEVEFASHRRPTAAVLLSNIKPLFAVAMRILFGLLVRSKFAFPVVVSVIRVLATMLDALSDTRPVENTHQHLRDLKRAHRGLVAGKVARSKRCMDSGVLEQLGIKHQKVDQHHFEANCGFGTDAVTMGWRHVASKHKLQKKWTRIMRDERSWSSSTRLSYRLALSSWHWLQERRRIDALNRPHVGAARLSMLLPFKRLVVAGDHVYICLDNAEWGGLGVPAQRVLDVAGDWKLWAPIPNTCWLHVWNLDHWEGAFLEPCCPLELNLRSERFPNHVLFRESSSRMALDRLTFSSTIILSHDQLLWLARQYRDPIVAATRNTSRNDVILAIAGRICCGDSPAEQMLFMEMVKAHLQQPSKKRFRLDAITEAAFESLDGTEQVLKPIKHVETQTH